jgi:hypothetical protein
VDAGGITVLEGCKITSHSPAGAHRHRGARAGADVVAPPHTTEFAVGGPTYACNVRDTGGNLWTFGTYPGAS